MDAAIYVLIYIIVIPILIAIIAAIFSGIKNKIIKSRTELLKKVASEKQIQMPCLSEAFADYKLMLDMETSNLLKYKKHPAVKAAEKVAQIARDKKELEKQYKMLKYQLNFYESIAPWLEDYNEFNLQDIEEMSNSQSDDEYENLKKWLSPDEYKKLSTADKYQLALDRYKKSTKKSAWQIGRDFERFVGYEYETKGYTVEYYGAVEGLYDLGRDIIARKNKETIIVQCKYWRKERTVHEKHIFQLYGTIYAEKIEKPNQIISGVFITTTTLSETAKKYAKNLNIQYIENANFQKDYPCIKCNISKRTGEKIYHLPFDQQYDRVFIELDRNEFYTDTVRDAEGKGFRRAHKWMPDR